MNGGRNWRQPSEVNLLHLMSDLHYTPSGISFTSTRGNKVINDLAQGDIPRPAARVVAGDLTNTATTAEDAAVQAFFASIAATTSPVVPMYSAIGNHDVNLAANDRTPAQWAAAYGYPAANYTVDVGFAQLIFVSFDSMGVDATTIRLSTDTLTWLDATLTALNPKPCIIVCHAPLRGTVVGVGGVYKGSTDAGFFVVGGTGHDSDSSPVTAVLAAHSNAKVWISGHTHSPIQAVNMVSAVTVGSRTMAAVCLPSLVSPATAQYFFQGVRTGWLNYIPGPSGDTIEVRWRDHTRRRWIHPFGNPAGAVMTVTGL